MLLSWIVVGTGLLVRTVVAHGWVGQITIAGTVYQGNGLGTTGGPSVIRQVDTNSPVTSVSDPNLSCGPHAQPASQIANANPGDAIAVDWVSTEGPWFHDVGPLLTYLANCGSQTCDQFDASQAQWFKIEEAGRDASGWAQAQLNSGAPATLNLPSNLAAGNYLLRHEIIALQNGGSQGGAEFYASCSQLKVGGSGTGAPTSSELVKFPGAYSATDPGILVDVYTNTGAPYSFPGPPIAAFAGGSPSPPATPTTQPGLSATTLPPGETTAVTTRTRTTPQTSGSGGIATQSAPAASQLPGMCRLRRKVQSEQISTVRRYQRALRSLFF